MQGFQLVSTQEFSQLHGFISAFSYISTMQQTLLLLVVYLSVSVFSHRSLHLACSLSSYRNLVNMMRRGPQSYDQASTLLRANDVQLHWSGWYPSSLPLPANDLPESGLLDDEDQRAPWCGSLSSCVCVYRSVSDQVVRVFMY